MKRAFRRHQALMRLLEAFGDRPITARECIRRGMHADYILAQRAGYIAALGSAVTAKGRAWLAQAQESTVADNIDQPSRPASRGEGEAHP